MKKKILFFVLALCLCLPLAIGLVGCKSSGNRNDVVQKFVVEFYDGDILIHSIEVNDGATIKAFENPTKDGYLFDGWYVDIDENITIPFDFSFTINASFSVYAKWVALHSVSFNSNGGTTVDAIQVVDGGMLTKPMDPIKNNYLFDGWYLNANLTEEFNFDSPITSDIILYAKWASFYNITYDYGQASFMFANAKATDKIKRGNSYGELPMISYAYNYCFLGWFEGNEKVEVSDVPDKNVTLVAKFDVAKSNVSGLYQDGKYVKTWSGMPYNAFLNNSHVIHTPTISSIDSYFTEIEGDLIIDQTITKIEDYAFCNCQKLKSVKFTSAVSIGSEAFYYCGSLANVILYSGTKTIPDDAFCGCVSLESIYIPNTVVSIGINAFRYCRKLKSIIIPSSVNSIGNYAFEECYNLVEVVNNSELNFEVGSTNYGSIAKYAMKVYSNGEVKTGQFYNDGNFVFYVENNEKWLVNYIGENPVVVIPDDVSLIMGYSFASNLNIYSVTIGANVTTIRQRAFSGCYHLVEVINNSGLNIELGSTSNGSVGLYALDVYAKNEEVTSSFITENDFVFYNNDDGKWLVNNIGSSKNIVIPNDVSLMINYIFAESDIKSVVIGSLIENIGDYAFYYCLNLTSVSIPNNVISIGKCAFYECRSLKSITIPNSVESIGESAFSGCIELTSVSIPNSIISIDAYAFSGCIKLTKVYIQSETVASGFTSKSAYGNLIVHATEIYIKSDITSIGDYVTDNFTLQEETEVVGGVVYNKYVKNN